MIDISFVFPTKIKGYHFHLFDLHSPATTTFSFFWILTFLCEEEEEE